MPVKWHRVQQTNDQHASNRCRYAAVLTDNHGRTGGPVKSASTASGCCLTAQTACIMSGRKTETQHAEPPVVPPVQHFVAALALRAHEPTKVVGSSVVWPNLTRCGPVVCLPAYVPVSQRRFRQTRHDGAAIASPASCWSNRPCPMPKR
jgi:hypothetical protein